MSMKKKLESKLANGVRQVKSQREQALVTPPKAAPVAKPVAKPTPASVVAKPVAPRAVQPLVAALDTLHPRRIWPD